VGIGRQASCSVINGTVLLHRVINSTVTSGTLQQAYLDKNPLSALVAFAIAGGWDQSSFMRRHFCGRALVRFRVQFGCASTCARPCPLVIRSKALLLSGLRISVPDHWIDSLFPEVRRILQLVQARNARLQSGKRHADDNVSDRAAEGFLQTMLYGGICFWQNLPFRTRR